MTTVTKMILWIEDPTDWRPCARGVDNTQDISFLRECWYHEIIDADGLSRDQLMEMGSNWIRLARTDGWMKEKLHQWIDRPELFRKVRMRGTELGGWVEVPEGWDDYED